MSALLAMWMMGLAALAALTPSAPSAAAASEVVMVDGLGPVRLEAVECVAIARSTTVTRLCHDPAHALAYVEVRGRFRPLCDVDRALFDAWLAAPSMGRFLAEHVEPGHRCH